MRLVNTSTLELHSFPGPSFQAPPYAILSHTWGDDEIVFDDVKNGSRAIPRHKVGFPKVEGSAQYAKRKGYDWIWIDTCCIDKSSSAELSEAINSMYLWYKNSSLCFAYLGDVHQKDELPSSRWFTRGWTLQELIAPDEVELLNADWHRIGSRGEMAKLLFEITGIDDALLAGDTRAGSYSVATRMSWAGRRETTRPEDTAYSLLGIFSVNLPLIYGEGRSRAFIRLQKEILKVSSDQSIFAFRPSVWHTRRPGDDGSPPLMGSYMAFHPSLFRQDGIVDDDPYERSHTALHPITMNQYGVTFRALAGPATYHVSESLSMQAQLIILNCCFHDNPLARPAFLVIEFDGLFSRIVAPLFRVFPSRSMSMLVEIVGPTSGDPGNFVERVTVADKSDMFTEKTITISKPPESGISQPRIGLSRIMITSKHFAAMAEAFDRNDLDLLPPDFGCLGMVVVTGPVLLDSFRIMWGYKTDSRHCETYGTNHNQYFGRQSGDAWKKVSPRCFLTESFGDGSTLELSMRVPCSLEGGFSPYRLPSSAVLRRQSGLLVRVEVRLRTFLNRTCVEVEIADYTPKDNVPLATY